MRREGCVWGSGWGEEGVWVRREGASGVWLGERLGCDCGCIGGALGCGWGAPGSFWSLDGTEVLCFRRWEEV